MGDNPKALKSIQKPSRFQWNLIEEGRSERNPPQAGAH